MNKVIDDLLENVKKFEIFFNEYEKEFYPEIRKMRRRLVYSLLAMIIFYIIDQIL